MQKFQHVEKIKVETKIVLCLTPQTERQGNYNPDVCIILMSNINIVFKKIKASLKKCSVALFVLILIVIYNARSSNLAHFTLYCGKSL